MSFFFNIFHVIYDGLWKLVIRPSRDEYDESCLGEDKLILKGKSYKRTDFSIINNRNQKLQCSFWEPFDEERIKQKLPCVIYLHGNSSSRCEATIEANLLLPLNITLFAFDFSGSGKSEGDYISLGWYEKDDVKCVVDYLRKTVYILIKKIE